MKLNNISFLLAVVLMLSMIGCKSDGSGKETKSEHQANVPDQTLHWNVNDDVISFDGKGTIGELDNMHRLYLNFGHGGEGLVVVVTNFRGEFLGKHDLTARDVGSDQPQASVRFNSSNPDGPSVFITKLCEPPVGFIEITSLDTQLNLVSGRFEADLCALNMYVEEPDKRNTTGTFKNIPLSPLLR